MPPASRPRPRTLLRLALLATALALAGAVTAQDLGEYAHWAADVEQARGHLLASREVYRRGQHVRAGVHAAHPIQELGYRLWRPVSAVDPDLGARVQAALKEPGRAVQARLPVREYDALVERTGVLLDRAVARVVPETVRSDPRFLAQVIEVLLTAIDEEYAEAVAGGQVVLEIEYQDAWGFFQRLRVLWPSLRRRLAGASATAVAGTDVHIASLERAFPGIDTPTVPVPVERVKQALDAVGAALRTAGPLGGSRP
ncbi:MAG: hypothetical protein K6T92_05975 [Candidatus Rokubacteria bacterium]|nr:hypothetical protein [Candidatus Rokubacteria bacterium]